MYKPESEYTKLALNAILDQFSVEGPQGIVSENIEEKLQQRRGCFVSLHKRDGSLRGCIGTIEPTERNLKEEITRNAVSAAFCDSRFEPLSPDELDDLEISVDVLTEPEEIHSFDDLDPVIFGVIVSDSRGRRAVLLPSIPSIDSVLKQVEIVKRKAGLGQANNSKLTFYRFTSNRYH
jgi:uncharacterized protein